MNQCYLLFCLHKMSCTINALIGYSRHPVPTTARAHAPFREHLASFREHLAYKTESIKCNTKCETVRAHHRLVRKQNNRCIIPKEFNDSKGTEGIVCYNTDAQRCRSAVLL